MTDLEKTVNLPSAANHFRLTAAARATDSIAIAATAAP
jgi:hypothetical protein